MPKVTLRYLRTSDKDEFKRAQAEKWEENFDFVHYFESVGHGHFEKYIEVAPLFREGKLIPKDHVPATFLFAFSELDEIVGRVSIRHILNTHLLKVGGHIGYGVCPSFRRLGFATEILKESLLYIKENIPSLKKVLLTCDEGNIGSQKTIEKNGGILEDIIEGDGGVKKMRFWIEL